MLFIFVFILFTCLRSYIKLDEFIFCIWLLKIKTDSFVVNNLQFLYTNNLKYIDMDYKYQTIKIPIMKILI